MKLSRRGLLRAGALFALGPLLNRGPTGHASSAVSAYLNALWLDPALCSALTGDPVAQLSLAFTIREKLDAQQDEGWSLYWTRRAAEGGYTFAASLLSQFYLTADRAPFNPAAGIRWCRRAADAGHMWSQEQLARHYLAGRFIARSEFWAIYWFHRAAWQGYANAMIALGQIHSEPGCGRPERRRALCWLTLGTSERPGMSWYGVDDADNSEAIALKHAIESRLTPEEREIVLDWVARWRARREIAEDV
jgi:hypothetical protein